jgi:hypothetical protein
MAFHSLCFLSLWQLMKEELFGHFAIFKLTANFNFTSVSLCV